MNNSLYHIFNEVKNGRLPKENAIEILRRFEMAQVPAGATDAGGLGDIMLEPVWQEKEVFNHDPEAELGYEYYLLLVCEQLVNLTEHGLQRVLERVGGTGRFLILHSGHQDPGQRFQDYGCQVFAAIQDLLGSHPRGKGLIQLVIPNQGTGQLSGGLAGMLKTARSENPKVLGQVIEIEPEAGDEQIIAKLAENRTSPKDLQIRYDRKKRWIQVWQEIAPPQSVATIPWKNRGVYLITGGVGGLGLIFAEEIARNVDHPTIILIGRSALDAAKQAALNRIERYGARVIYNAVDVTSREAVERLMKTIQNDPGTLNGIIHAAGVIRDNLIRNKTVEEVKAVLAPKVSGLVNLDEASLAVDLDFLVLFSSGAAAFGNAGQADYAAANAFMDQYANYRNALVARGERCGKTISINWPLWNDGGMQIAEAFQKQIAADTGLVPLQTATGVRAFSQIMALNRPQIMVMAGELAKLRELLSGGAAGEAAAGAQGPHPVEPFSATDLEAVKQKTIDRFKGLLSEAANLSPDQIEADVPFDQYGVDSLMITQLNQKLNTVYGQLSKTVFYEYQTLESLVDYLMAEYPQNCLQWTGMGQRESPASESAEAKAAKRGFSHLRPVQPRKIPERHYHWRGALGKQSREPIAIIGIAGQFPQAHNIEEFWENLRAGKECISEIPEVRWPLADFYQPDKAQAIMQGKSYNKWGAFIADYDQFDPLFFNLTPREAELIDPQERLFLTECWKALEDAGYAPSGLAPKVRRRTGVFAGITKQGFNLYTLGTARHLPATSFASLVNRVSYFLDLQGPSMPIDTMCSSSLVAIHEACEYLRNGRGDLALAGGVNLYLHPATYVGLSSVQLLSETRECRSFGKGGTGFVPGEGVGVVVLKRFKQALNDGDHIYALIKGSAVNHKGKNKGYTIPEPNQQAAVIRQALAENRIDPRTVSYIEACANGSEMGDAIEMRALQKVFRQRNQVEGDYRIGSVKPNIGHCESASGMSQLVKVVLALRRQTLPPTIVSGELNPEIDYRQFPFEIQRELTAWRPVVVDGVPVPRRAGINNIGAGGVNAHLILEEYIPASADFCDEAAALEEHLFVLSAKNQAELEQYVKSWIEYLRRNPGLDPGDLTYTLQVGREAMPSRLALIIKTAAELGHKLELWLTDRENLDFGFGGDLKVTQRLLRDEVTEAIQARNLSQLARLWTVGNAIPWNHLHPPGKRHRTGGLPTYPFNQRKCWSELNRIDQTGRREPMAPIHQEHANKAVEFYTLTASERARDFREEYLTFCPFPQKIPGFSMTRVYINPEQYPAEAELVKAKQIEMRQVLFYREDFNRVHSLFDIGCGHGTDVIQIAALYPHLKTQGFTITQAQAELGNQRIAQMGLNAQAQIFHRDSAKDAFPGQYDLIIGIEVSFHIRNKDGVFHNIATALNPGGKVLLIDYIANLRGPIVDPQVEVSISTLQDWVRILSQHQLVIDELIDVSPQIANFLADPDFEQNTAHLPKVVQDTFRNYANQSISLEKGWLSYCLFKLKKDTQRSESERREYNATQITRKIPYAEALADMVKRGHIPYPKPHPTFTAKMDTPPPEVSDRRREVQALTPIADAAVPVHDGVAIKRDLEEIFATVLGLQREDIQAGTFEELGVGSLNAIQLLEGINSRFDLQLPPQHLSNINV